MNSNKDRSINISSLIRRLLALLADFSIAHMALYGLLSFKVFEQRYSDLSNFLLKLVKASEPANGAIFSQGLATFIFVFILYLAFRFYSTLAFGVSFSQYLLGLRGVGDGTWKRLGGGARVILETFLGPLVLGEVSLLFKKVSLKEFLSHTKIISTNSNTALYLGLIWVPMLIVCSTISPLFKGLALMDGVRVSTLKERINLKSQRSFDGFKNYSSNRFKFEAFSSLDDGRFILLPSFEIVKEGSRKKIKPYLWLYDLKKKRDAFIKIETRFSLMKILDKARLGNPFFDKQFPHLSSALKGKRGDYSKVKYERRFESDTLFNEEVKENISELVKSSLALGSGNIVKHLLSFGPFIRGFVIVRNEILSKSFEGVPPEVDFGKIGSQSFLRFKQLFDEKAFFNKRMIETYIPLETNNSVVLRFYWGEDLASALSRKSFKESFLQSMVWYFDYINVFPFPKRADEISTITILDSFTKMDLTKEQRQNLEEAIFSFYFKLGRSSLKLGDSKLQDILFKNLERTFLVANYINKNTVNYYSEKFLIHLKDLKYSIKSKDVKYFGLK